MVNTVILCVDDDPDVLELLAEILEESGFSVLLAHNGLDALALAFSRKPALILLDLVLPDMPGEEVCRKLRSHSPTAKSPIIMLSVKSAEAAKVTGLEIGADDYVTKPFSPRILVARIKALLRNRGFLEVV